MIHGVIDGQNLRVDYDPVVADSQNYLFAKFRFESPEWRDEIVKVAHFSKDGVTYDFVLDENDEIMADRGVNLTEGVWTVYIHGNRTVDGDIVQRIPTNGAELIVKNSPIPAEGVFPAIPVSIVEQILAKIGDTTDLKTIDRRSLVHAINELYYTQAPMVDDVSGLLGKIDYKMEYAILDFDGTAFKLNGDVLTFQQIKELCLDDVHFVYAQYENRLYIPQYVSGSNIFFDASYIQSDIPKMNRISISSSGAVGQYHYDLAKASDVAVKVDKPAVGDDGMYAMALGGSVVWRNINEQIDPRIAAAVAEAPYTTYDAVDSAIKYELFSRPWSDAEKTLAQERLGIVTITQEEYDLIESPSDNVIYIIVG